MFLFIACGQYPNIFFEFLLIKKQILEVLKICFRMYFSNTTKNYFFYIFEFYNMFVKLQRVLANIPKKIQKSYFFGESHLLFTVNVWIKKFQRDEYPKYYWE
jgi:hypothetical protein